MQYVRILAFLMVMTSLLFLIIGLIKPWMMLWWEDEQNRLKVIKSYGSLTVILAIVYYVVRYIEQQKLMEVERFILF